MLLPSRERTSATAFLASEIASPISIRYGKAAASAVENAWNARRVINTGPRITIRDHYDHHTAMRADVIDQLEGQGFTVSYGEASCDSLY